ncbi:acyl carrier protein [Paraburkholderia azotifigens]|uniref:phosphopantetheine-binding protein n=1 Tax=Paraburkholderia azotifigens TaxID=2057004 RepID=UPI00048A5F41
MNSPDIRVTVLTTLQTIAPEVDITTLRDDRPLRKQVDLDSMDWLNFLTAIHEKFHVEIPEVDYERLSTLADVVAYLEEASKAS